MMAEGRTCRINLAALQQRDPYITNILETASQVALYSFSSKMNEWEKTDIEGTLFVYTRSAVPINGFMILNRLGMNNQIEPITKDLEFQLQDPFLLYKNTSSIYGIWFYDKDECARIGQLMNSLVQVTFDSDKQNKSEPNNRDRFRRASESDTMFERRTTDAKGQIDIMQLLCRAQDEYDKTKGRSSSPKKHDPKPFIDNPNASSNNLVKPTAIKPDQDINGMKAGYSSKGSTQVISSAINLETLFGQAHAVSKPEINDRHHGGGDSDLVPLTPVSASQQSVLDRIMSRPGNTLAEIERKQRSEIDKKDYTASPRRDLLGGAGDNEPVYAKPNKKSGSQSPSGSDESHNKAINQLLSNQLWTSSTVKPEGLLTPADLNSPSTSTQSNSSSQPVPLSLAMLASCQTPGSPRKQSSPPPLAGFLMSPMAFEKSATGLPPLPLHHSPLPTMQPPRPDSMLLAFDPIPPMGGVNVNGSSTVYGAGTSGDNNTASRVDVRALTLEQLQQSFIYLLKNDADFMKKIHEAYIKSLGLP